MQNNFRMSEEIYFIDLGTSKEEPRIEQGTIISIGISTEGYVVYSIMDPDTKILNKEEAYIFKTQEEAKLKFDEYVNFKNKVMALEEGVWKEINTLRKQILGEPTMKDFIRE